MIFISVGTQKFQMDRLLKEMDRLLSERVIDEEVVAQTGYCRYAPAHFPARPFLTGEEMARAIADCDIVVCHGGTGTILSGVRAGKKVVVVPRQARYGEHVDDHQLEIATAFERKGHVLVVREIHKMAAVLEKARFWTPTPFESNTDRFMEFLISLLIRPKG